MSRVDWDEDLLYAQKHGMDYVEKFNVEQTIFRGNKNLIH